MSVKPVIHLLYFVFCINFGAGRAVDKSIPFTKKITLIHIHKC